MDFVPDNIDWFKNGEKLQSNVERGVSIKFSVTMETKTIKSTFRVEHARMTDAGTYTCRTSNSLVESTSVVVLYGKCHNHVVTYKMITRHTSTDVSDVCHRIGRGLPNHITEPYA